MNDVDIAMRELSKIQKRTAHVEKKRYVPPFQLLTAEEVAEAIRLSKNTVYRMVDKTSKYFDETFPEPLKVGGRSTMWRADEITAWMLGLRRGVGQPINTSTKTPNAKVSGVPPQD